MGNMQDALRQIQSGGSYTAPASVSQKTGTQTGSMKSVLKQIESGNTPQGYANILDRYKNTPSYSSVLGRQKGPYAQAVEDNRNAKLGEKLKGITGGTLKGLGKTYAADIANAVATLGQSMGAWVESNPMAQSLARPADVLKSREEQRRDQDEAMGKLQEWSDRTALAGQQDIQRAQSYTGAAGDALIEAGVGAGQSLIDMGIAATGVGAMVPLVARVYGGATRQARQEGKDLTRQNLYGMTSGAVEGLVEKLTGGVGRIYGGGAADDLIEALVGKTTMGNAGRNILRGVINAQGEGIEEAISSLLSPAVDAIYKGNLAQNYSEYEIREALQSYLVGALSGGMIETLRGATGASRAANAVLEDATVQEALGNYWQKAAQNGAMSQEARTAFREASARMNEVRSGRTTTPSAQGTDTTQPAGETLAERVSEITAEEKTAQRAAETRMEGLNENLSDAGQGDRDDGIGAGGPGGVFSAAAGEPRTDGQGNLGQNGRGAEAAESEVLREVSPAELGIAGGNAESRVQILNAERAGGVVADAANTVRSAGMEPVAFRGEMRVGNASVNGYMENGRIYFRTDAVDGKGRVITPEQIVEHELFHASAEPETVKAVSEAVREQMTEAEFAAMCEDYKRAYSKVQDFSGWTAEEIAEYLYQEIAADAYAGLNYFNDNSVEVPKTSDIIRENADGRMTNGQGASENVQRAREDDFDARGQNIGILGGDGRGDRGVSGREVWAEEQRNRDARKTVREITKIFGTAKAVKPETEELIDQALRKIEINGSLNQKEKWGLLLELVSTGEIRTEAENYYSKARERLYKQRIYVPEGIRAEFPDEYDALRRRAFGARVYLTGDKNDGKIDTIAEELAEVYPEFSDYTNQSAMLRRMVDYAAEGARKTVALDDYLSSPVSDFGPYEYGLMHFEAELEDALEEYAVRHGGPERESEKAIRERIQKLQEERDGADSAEGYYAAQDELEFLQEQLEQKADGRASVEVPGEKLTPQERELINRGEVHVTGTGGETRVELQRFKDGWHFRIGKGRKDSLFASNAYQSAEEAAREAIRIGRQYALPQQTRAQNALNAAADEAVETPPPIGRFTKAERDLEEDRLRTLTESVPWGAGSITLSQDQEAAAAAETFADERAERQAAEDMAGYFEDFNETVRSQIPVRDETTGKVGTELKKKEQPRKEQIQSRWRSLVRTVVNAGDTIHRIARETGNKALDGYYFRALAARQAGTEWIAGKRHDIMGRQIGQGLNEIFNPIREKGKDYYEQFQMYLYHQLNIDRMSRDYEKDAREAQAEVDRLLRVEPGLANLSATRLQQIANGLTMDAQLAKDYLEAVQRRNAAERKGPKPVFGFDVSAEDSRAAVEKQIEKHPEFEELAVKVYEFSNDLLQHRVDAGLIQQKDKEFLQRLYPHYVPTFRATAEERARILHKGGLSVSKAIGRATGSNDVLLPLHVSLARQAMTVTKNGTINRLGNALLKTRDENKDAMSRYILDVQEAESGFSEDSFDEEETLEPRKENVITIIEDGKRYDLTLDDGLTEAFKAFEPDPWADKAIAQVSKGMVDLFKKLVTAYNPLFVVRNAIRDVQDAGLYSVDIAAWAKNFPRAYQEMAREGEYWQMYKGLGGNYASFFDYATGEVRAENAGIVGKIELANRWVEAAPRLAEFMTVIQKAEARGEVTEADIMEAFEAAQDITTNFGRAGSLGKLANKYMVPFLNPSIQGADKFIRTLTEGKSAKAWAALAVKAAALGIAPTVLNALLYRDDEEWEDISDTNKANYYLFKGRDGVWIKIPKGRAIATLSAGAVAASEALSGDELDPREYMEIVAGNIAPQNPLEANIFKAWFDADLFNAESKGKTWYGGTIETERMQSYRPGERYDESTDIVSKWIGDKLNLSPAKINYLIDQYSGVIGDMLLPMLKPQAERDPVSKAFTIDTVTNNEATGEYYDTLDELKWDMNGGDIAAGTTYRYMSRANSAVSDYYSQIREIEADENLTNREKKELTRELYRDLVAYQKEIMATTEEYRIAAENFFDEHPELDHEDPEAVKAYMEQYNAQQSTEEYYKTESQIVDLMEAIVYREVNREVLGAEYALETYGESVYERAVEVHEGAGVSYDAYYDYYFGTKDMHADRDENGKSISGTKKAKVLGFIAGMDISDEQKDALAIDAGYKAGSWKSYGEGKSGGGSGGGRGRKAKAVKIKTTLTKPVGISYNRSMSVAARTPGKEISAYEGIRKATSELRKKNPWYALPTGNPELDEERPAAARYFATGKL